MVNTKKSKKVKKVKPAGLKRILNYFKIIFVIVAILGITLGILNWYEIIKPYWY